MLATCII